jgi:hypothetical protein
VRDIAQQLLFRLEQLSQALRHGIEIRSEQPEIISAGAQRRQHAHIEIPGSQLARRQPQSIDRGGQIARQEITDSRTRDERDGENRERHTRQLELAEQPWAPAHRTDHDVVAAAGGGHQNERTADRGDRLVDAAGACVGAGGGIGRCAQPARQRTSEHFVPVGADHERTGKWVGRERSQPALQRRSASGFERPRCLRVQLAALHPRTIRSVGGRVDSDRDRTDENESERCPEGEEDAPVQRVHIQPGCTVDAVRSETSVSA